MALRKQGTQKEQPAMVYGAIDLHTRYSQIRILDATGAVLGDRRVLTTRERLVAVFAGHGPIQILLETGTESEWVAQALEEAGYRVIVADPNFAPMYGDVRRTVKTDRRDVAALAEANRRGWYRPAYRCSAPQRALRQVLSARRQLVSMRSGTISVIRALLRQEGYRLPSGDTERLPARFARLALPPALGTTLTPLVETVAALTAQIATIDTRLQQHAANDPVVARLRSVPGVGLVVALTFRARIDDVGRFASASQVSAALGLVPHEASSAERRHRGHITKAGPPELRSLLVQAAWACWRSRQGHPLRHWAEAVASRRGRRIAIVGLARRLSRILFAMWRDGTTYRPEVLVAA
jgi:transposase